MRDKWPTATKKCADMCKGCVLEAKSVQAKKDLSKKYQSEENEGFISRHAAGSR